MKIRNQFRIGVAAALGVATMAVPASAQWKKHLIYKGEGYRAADGQHHRDVNGDGLDDLVVAHDSRTQGGVSIFLHPGAAKAKEPWKDSVFLPTGMDIEGASFADIDGDGAYDVISANQNLGMFLHWAPKNKADYTDASKWTTVKLPGSKQSFDAAAIQLDGKNGLDIIAGSSDCLWFECPPNPRDMSAWKVHTIQSFYAGMTRTFFLDDMDADGDPDVLIGFSKAGHGSYWFENPGPGEALAKTWKRHTIYGGPGDATFGSHADLDGDGIKDFLYVGGRNPSLVFMKRLHKSENSWKAYPISPEPWGGTNIKGSAVGDLNGNGRPDVVLASGENKGLLVIEWSGSPATSSYRSETALASSPKCDFPELYDVDGDGDLDIFHTHEQSGGIYWMENPLGKPPVTGRK